MRTVGLITEYNPFHNGHAHHLQESLQVTGSHASVAVMSGHFLQRGEPALLDKWQRVQMALAAGVDLVLELPFVFACNSAPCFAMGAVQSLNALGVVDTLCFGSEAGTLAPLQQVAEMLLEHAPEIEAQTASELRTGKNYPAARAEVLARLAPEISGDITSSPNNILGLEYLRALLLTASSMQPATIPRIGAGYHSVEAVGAIASATGIRQSLKEGRQVCDLMPASSWSVLQQALVEGFILDDDKLFATLQTLLLQEPETLEGIYQVADGLPIRLTESALTAESYDGLVDAIKSRHWTRTRIQRILCYVLMQVAAEEMSQYLASGPLYLRLLGASEKGRQVLARARKRRTLPMISDPARASATLKRFYREKPENGELAERMLKCDLRATRIYGLLQKVSRGGYWNRDFFMNPELGS